MSELCTRIKNWPLITVSPIRARISITLPEASEMTGIFRETSGLTLPVTFKSGACTRSPAVTSGNWSGRLLLTTPLFPSCSTVAGKDAVDFASTSTLAPQPARKRHKSKEEPAVMMMLRVMGSPRLLPQDSVGSQPGINHRRLEALTAGGERE